MIMYNIWKIKSNTDTVLIIYGMWSNWIYKVCVRIGYWTIANLLDMCKLSFEQLFRPHKKALDFFIASLSEKSFFFLVN